VRHEVVDVKGVIYNLVENVVRSELGDDAWDYVIDESGVSGAYTSLGTYPDSDLTDIAASVAHQVGSDPSSVIRHVGHEGLSILAERYPEFFTPHDDVRSFLMTLNEIIHPEVRRLYPGALVPDFEYRTPEPDVIELVYRSERGRCDLAEGLVLGVGRHYGQRVEVSQPECVHRGDPHCVLRVVTS
jgi:hypothetical protein